MVNLCLNLSRRPGYEPFIENRKPNKKRWMFLIDWAHFEKPTQAYALCSGLIMAARVTSPITPQMITNNYKQFRV